MTLDLNVEKEMLRVYHLYWDSYLSGDVPMMEALLDKNYQQIGSAEAEVFNNKKDAVQFLYDTIDQVAGKTELRNRTIKIQAVGSLFLVDDLLDIYVLIDEEWRFYSKFRATSLMDKKNDNWLFLHQHSSMPDMRAVEGENLAIDTVASENLQLRDAVKRRTTELEQKNRELEIETSLERVRAAAMSMRQTKELLSICDIMYRELVKLGFTELRNAMINIHHDEDGSFLNYDSGQTITRFEYDAHPFIVKQVQAMKSAGDAFSETYLEGAELDAFRSFRMRNGEEDDPMLDQTDTLGYYFYSIGTGSIGISTFGKISHEKKQVLKKFRNAFDFAYQRFRDLSLAEDQAREAQIQLALERVRARTMAMQQSEELPEAANLLFHQMQQLGMPTWSAGYCTWADNKKSITAWMSSEGVMQPPFIAPLNEDPTFIHMLDSFQKGNELHVEAVGGEGLVTHYKYMRTLPVVGEILDSIIAAGHPLPSFQIMHCAYFSKGFLLFITYEPVVYAHEIFKRFAVVFEQTYTRFNDLRQAEAQAHSAQIETALERVRARALAMQEPEELIEVSQVLRREMGLLGVEELETCSIYIHDGVSEHAECWYALKDSGASRLVSDHFLLNLNDTWVGRKMLDFYTSPDKQVSIIMTGEPRKEWIRYCEERSKPLKGYYGEVVPDRTYHLARFSQGAIGAASAGDISAESWDLLHRTATVFSLAYSRFKDLTQAREDLKKLKEEKLRAETALTHLKSAQTQLIQAEKMASLGELTAGIAHEIQNPLNFVNNFSEVNQELIEELKEELVKGNFEDLHAILDDVKSNEEKINHHGKRADAIVKGMLQHSRSGSGTKEPTDINRLADEYLRLSYHGLRAKDKSFNAALITDFDESIGKVSIIPEDIGRVLLNLINNAFYAVNEKRKLGIPGYEPSVQLSTLRQDNEVRVEVKDNGQGIPSANIKKIFQPFFTTKPTGEGTGLGLSLCYDMVKAHGGEIKVSSEEGGGSVFTVVIPE